MYPFLRVYAFYAHACIPRTGIYTCTTLLLIHAGVSVELQEIMFSTGIRKEDLNNEVKNVMHLASKFADHNWLEYAITLGLNDSELRHIKTDLQLDSEFLKAHQMLKMWHRRNGCKATYKVLVDACCSRKNMKLATDLCQLLNQ